MYVCIYICIDRESSELHFSSGGSLLPTLCRKCWTILQPNPRELSCARRSTTEEKNICVGVDEFLPAHFNDRVLRAFWAIKSRASKAVFLGAGEMPEAQASSFAKIATTPRPSSACGMLQPILQVLLRNPR